MNICFNMRHCRCCSDTDAFELSYWLSHVTCMCFVRRWAECYWPTDLSLLQAVCACWPHGVTGVKMSISSDEVNFLVYRYLQESGTYHNQSQNVITCCWLIIKQLSLVLGFLTNQMLHPMSFWFPLFLNEVLALIPCRTSFEMIEGQSHQALEWCVLHPVAWSYSLRRCSIWD